MVLCPNATLVGVWVWVGGSRRNGRKGREGWRGEGREEEAREREGGGD